jgi:hypothetical protein
LTDLANLWDGGTGEDVPEGLRQPLEVRHGMLDGGPFTLSRPAYDAGSGALRDE